MKRLMAVVICVAAALAPLRNVPAQEKQDRATRVRNDRKHVEAGGTWIYGDLPRGIAEARKTGKPLLVVLRCIPCEACAQLDENVVDRDAAVRELLDQFVCVRIPHGNGLDLSLFQFDYDQSWAAFLLGPDLTIYGRYGTRSHRTHSENDVSLEGFAKALQGALDLHARSPQDKLALAQKRGAPSEFKAPEDLPSLAGRYKPSLDWDGKVVQSCIHCHQIGEALRSPLRSAGKPIPDALLFPYPNPKVLGLVLDPKERVRVQTVTPGSPAEKGGFRAGDEIATLEGQPLLSIADVQWVLQHAGETATLRAEVMRDRKTVPLSLALAAGWRQKDDISWRTTTWDLRRMVTGGLVFEDLPDAERVQAGIAKTALALRVRHVGQYGEHAAGKNAGFQQGDVCVARDGNSERMTDTELLATLVRTTKPGDKVVFTVARAGKKLDLTLPMH